MEMRSKYLFAVALFCLAIPGKAFANPITLTFDAWSKSQFTIGNYFNGGLSGFPTLGNGPNDGVVFSTNAEELKEVTGNTSGKFENNPSSLNGVLYFAFSPTSTSYFNDASGFSAISFDYSLLNNLPGADSTVNLYSGLNGTGALLASLELSANANTTACTVRHTPPTPADEFCTWSLASASGFGAAESAVFSLAGDNTTTLNQEFDSLILTPVPVPEPGSLLLLAGGLGALLGFSRLVRWRMG